MLEAFMGRQAELAVLPNNEREGAKPVCSRKESQARDNCMKLSFSIKLNFHFFSLPDWLISALPQILSWFLFFMPQHNDICTSQYVHCESCFQIDLNLILKEILCFQLDAELSLRGAFSWKYSLSLSKICSLAVLTSQSKIDALNSFA